VWLGEGCFRLGRGWQRRLGLPAFCPAAVGGGSMMWGMGLVARATRLAGSTPPVSPQCCLEPQPTGLGAPLPAGRAGLRRGQRRVKRIEPSRQRTAPGRRLSQSGAIQIQPSKDPGGAVGIGPSDTPCVAQDRSLGSGRVPVCRPPMHWPLRCKGCVQCPGRAEEGRRCTGSGIHECSPKVPGG
jgi:hypothetical protein